MDKIIPLISSGTAGPLGVLHLPRLWLKSSLESCEKLADGYPGCGKGYDQMVLDGLGLDRDKFMSYIRSARPTYPQLEDWIKTQPGVKLDAASIQKLNSSITGYNHVDETRKEVLACCGLTDEGKIKDAVNLNNLDDWASFHQATLK